MAPAQPGEPAEIPIGGDPLASGLDGERGQVRVGYEVPLRAGGQAEPLEDFPVTGAGRDNHGIRL